MPSVGLRIQAQTVPVTTNESAIGNRKMLRNTDSPRMCWSMRMASSRPMSDAAAHEHEREHDVREHVVGPEAGRREHGLVVVEADERRSAAGTR